MGESVAVRYHASLRQPVRSGAWRDQGTSTYRLAASAVQDGRFADAGALGRHTVEEAREARDLYPEFIDRARRFLLEQGVPRDVLDREEKRIAAILRMPDGSNLDIEQGWQAYTSLIDSFARACDDRRTKDALSALEEARETWRRTHDRACDWIYALLDVVTRHLGEDRIGDAWNTMMQRFYPSRDRYDVARTPWSESLDALLYDTPESLRGHLSGPDRSGEVEIVEEADRFAFRFDPCGSGGRTLRDDPAEGGPPRMEPPFNFAVTREPHPWAWNLKGVCLYCVHCCLLQQVVPIRKFGYPVRVVEPPTWPQSRQGTKCTWYVYKDPALVPEGSFEQVGETKPGAPPIGTRRTGSSASPPSL